MVTKKHSEWPKSRCLKSGKHRDPDADEFGFQTVGCLSHIQNPDFCCLHTSGRASLDRFISYKKLFIIEKV